MSHSASTIRSKKKLLSLSVCIALSPTAYADDTTNEQLIEEVLKQYNQALAIDSENTDSLFFILEDVAEDNDLTEEEFNQLCKEVDKLV